MEAVNLTDAQKRDARLYDPDCVLVFNRDTSGFRKGQRGRLLAINAGAIVIEAKQIRVGSPSRFGRRWCRGLRHAD